MCHTKRPGSFNSLCTKLKKLDVDFIYQQGIYLVVVRIVCAKTVNMLYKCMVVKEDVMITPCSLTALVDLTSVLLFGSTVHGDLLRDK